MTNCDGLQFYGGSVTGVVEFPFGMSNIASLGSVEGGTVTVGETGSGPTAVRVVSNSSVSSMAFDGQLNYRFDDSVVSGVDFAESSRVDLNGSSCYNCSFGVRTSELSPCYEPCGGSCEVEQPGCTANYSQILGSVYSVKLSGKNPGLYYAVVESTNGTGVLVDGADGAVIREARISGTQGLYVKGSKEVSVEYVTFEPDKFDVDWALRETLSLGDEYEECVGGLGLEPLERVSFAGGMGGSGYSECFSRPACLYEVSPGEFADICGCYQNPGDVPYGCTVLSSVPLACAPGTYGYCYGNAGSPLFSQLVCAGYGSGGEPQGGGPGYAECASEEYCMVTQGLPWSCGSEACADGKVCCSYLEFPEYDSCQEQGYADGVCQASSPSGYGACGASDPCGSGMSCWCPLPEAYASCSDQGFERALCNVLPPSGTALCPGSVACGESASCWCAAPGEWEPVEWCVEPGDCMQPINESCVSNWIPFIVVDGSDGVTVARAVFTGEGVLIDVEADSNWVSIEDNEFNDEALVYLRGDYNSFKNNSFSPAINKFVGIDVLGKGNALDGFTLPYSQGINVWGNENKVSSVSFGNSEVAFDVVNRGWNNEFYSVESGKAAFVKPVAGASEPLVYPGELFAFSSFNGVSLDGGALARYLSGSTGDLSFDDSSSTLDREWVVRLQALDDATELPVAGATVSFHSLGGQGDYGSGIADAEGFVEFNVTQGLFDSSSSQALPAGLRALSFESASFNPYLFTASGEGLGEASREVEVVGDSDVILRLLEGNFASCVEQGFADGVCQAAAPPAYHACGGVECGDGLSCYCPPAAVPSPSAVPGVYLGIVGLSRNQLPGTVEFGAVLQVDGQGDCSDLSVSVTAAGQPQILFLELKGCDLRTGLHSYEVELSAPGLYEVLVNGEGKTDRASFSLIAQQPVATPDSSLFGVALAALLALYALKKKC